MNPAPALPVSRCRRAPRRRRGLALIVVLWAIMVMGLAVAGLVRIAQAGLEDVAEREKYQRALLLAASGVTVALQPQVPPGDPVLRQSWNADEQFAATLKSEGARIPVNEFLQDDYRDVWQRLLQSWGLPPADADRVFDSLMDWVHPGAGRRLNGAELADYQRAGLRHGPTGKPFTSFEEMEQVLNFDLLRRRKPDWRESFTLWSSGQLDINAAPAELIAAVTGAELAKARALTQYRDGRDGVPETEDDQPFKDVQAIQGFLGLPNDRFERVRPRLALQSPITRIRSRGTAYGRTLTVDVIASRDALKPVIYSWNEH